MMRLCANLTTLYADLPLIPAMEAAKADGFTAVECRTVFDVAPAEIKAALQRLDLRMVQFNSPMGNFAAGDRGLTCVPGREAEFRDSITRTITYAQALGVEQVNCVGGLMPPSATREDCQRTMVENLRYAAPLLADAGIRLQIEPINPVDTKGVFLSDLACFAEVHDRVRQPNLWLQYDIYHMAMIGQDILAGYDRFAPLVSHVQVADCPGRHEPGGGGIDYARVFAHLEARGYQGWIGCEYLPKADVAAGLGWIADHGLAAG